MPAAGEAWIGDTVNLHAPRSEDSIRGGPRSVELVVNGRVVASREVPADGSVHELEFETSIHSSSWVALRHFPELHTNPVVVEVGNRPIRASRKSALWCAETIRSLWKHRKRFIAADEQPLAKATYDRAIDKYLQIAGEFRE